VVQIGWICAAPWVRVGAWDRCGGRWLGGVVVSPGERAEQPVQFADANADLLPEVLCQLFPLLRAGNPAVRNRLGQGGPDLRQGQAGLLADPDHGDPAQHIAAVAALVATGEASQSGSACVRGSQTMPMSFGWIWGQEE
jgi:hypothetical protein